jgi:tetratricopeptide (TPR) repeat protein
MKQNINNILPGTIVCLLLISFLCEGYAQKFLYHNTYNVDSLLLILPDQQAEERVNTLNNLTVSLYFEEIDLGKQYAEKALNLAKELNYQKGVADAYEKFGFINYFLGNYPTAVNNFFESLRIYEELGEKNTVARLYYEIAHVHFNARNIEKTIEYLNISLDKYRERLEGGAKVGRVRDTLMLIATLGLAYYTLGMFNKSVEIALLTVDVGLENNFGITELMLHTFLAGKRFYLAGKPDSAKVYLGKALAYPDANPDIQALKYRPVTWLGNLYSQLGEIDTAILYLSKAYHWYSTNGFLYWSMKVSNDLGKIYFERNELNTAEKYYRQSEMFFNEALLKDSWYRHDSLKYIVNYGFELYFPMPTKRMKEMTWIEGKSMYYRLYQISEAMGKTSKALTYIIEYINASDTLNKIKRTRETIEMHTRYESERKDQEIDKLSLENKLTESRLNQNKYFLFGSAVLLIFILMFGYILFRQNKLKTEQKMMGLQQKLFRSQMNPHFIFNSLASIQHFIIKQDSKKASIYLSRFSELVRSILESSTREYITFEKEVSTIENYLELQRVRFSDKFDYSIEVDEKIDSEGVLIPPMLAQPFIENSIEHGIKHKKSKGNINIRFTLKNNMIVFEVEDDGVGREKAREILEKQNKDHRSMATNITRDRIHVLNKKLRQKISLTIADLKDDKGNPAGTNVTFDIPLKS